jgi:hypothetical protein
MKMQPFDEQQRPGAAASPVRPDFASGPRLLRALLCGLVWLAGIAFLPGLRAGETQAAVWCTNPPTTLRPGQTYTPNITGGSGEGAYQFCIGTATDLPGLGGVGVGQAGTQIGSNVSTSWAVPANQELKQYTLYVRRYGSVGYDDSAVVEYGFTVAKDYQSTGVVCTNASAAILLGQPWSPIITGGTGTGAYQFCIAGITDFPGAYGMAIGQPGTLAYGATAAVTSWTPSSVTIPYTLWVRRAGDLSYVDSQPVSYPLTVSAPPVITTQPVDRASAEGQTVIFSVAATGTPTPTYQWRKNGANIAGATAASLTLTNITRADAASYAVVVTNSAGSVTSNSVRLAISGYANEGTYYISYVEYKPYDPNDPTTRVAYTEHHTGMHIVAGGDPALVGDPDAFAASCVNALPGSDVTYSADAGKSIHLVNGFRAIGGSRFHAYSGSYVPTPGGLPGPINLRVALTLIHSVDLVWNLPLDAGYSSQKLSYALVSSENEFELVLGAGVAAQRVPGLVSNRDYRFFVRGVDSAGRLSPSSNIVVARTRLENPFGLPDTAGDGVPDAFKSAAGLDPNAPMDTAPQSYEYDNAGQLKKDSHGAYEVDAEGNIKGRTP